MERILKPVFNIESKYINRKAQIRLAIYGNDATAVQVVAPIKDKSKLTEVIATISVNHETSTTLPKNRFYGKGYSENEGILESMEESGIIKCIKKEGVQSGHVTLPIYELTV
jgi:hypothetical protein